MDLIHTVAIFLWHAQCGNFETNVEIINIWIDYHSIICVLSISAQGNWNVPFSTTFWHFTDLNNYSTNPKHNQ